MLHRLGKSARLLIGVVSIIAAGYSVQAAAQTADDDYQRNVFASHSAGVWRAQAAFYSTDYDYGPQYQCRMQTPGAVLTQVRPRESGSLQAGWRLLEDIEDRRGDVTFDWVRVGRRRFELRRLPWRLVQPSDSGIVLSYDRAMLAIRRDTQMQWLPLEYLTLDLLEARAFEIGFHYQDDETEQVRHERRTINLSGFAEVARWCGRQLLRDRANDRRVRELLQ